MSDNANINKQYEINKAKQAIANAREYLKIENQSEEYYIWHNNTIEKLKIKIKNIIEAPITDWN